MADAKKCDRCGKYYDAYGTINMPDLVIFARDGTIVDNDYDYVEIQRWELCPACMQTIHYHMTNASPQE